MKVKFNVTGQERKLLVGAISQELNAPTKYLGAPTFSYKVDYFTIDKVGTLIFDDRANSEEIETLLETLSKKGFTPEQPTQATTAESLEEATKDSTSKKELAQGEIMGLTIEMPRDFFTNTTLDNLEKLIKSKAALIKKALGVDSLPIRKTDDRVSFPWFHGEQDSNTVKAYTHFITALCEMAKTQKRINTKEKPVENDKYAFRCFILRLGFIGKEYKEERKILLKNLTGSSAYAKPNIMQS